MKLPYRLSETGLDFYRDARLAGRVGTLAVAVG